MRWKGGAKQERSTIIVSLPTYLSVSSGISFYYYTHFFMLARTYHLVTTYLWTDGMLYVLFHHHCSREFCVRALYRGLYLYSVPRKGTWKGGRGTWDVERRT